MRILSTLMIVTVFAFFAFISCSGSGSIVTPGTNPDISKYSNLPVGVSEYDNDGNPLSGWGVLGLFNLVGNPSSADLELVPLRETSLFDTLEVVDISNFLSLAPCTDCARIESVEMIGSNEVQLNISIRHPFAAGDPFKPISGRNRADLHVFNVEGLIIASGSTETPVTFPGLGETAGNARLVNADGYSSYLDGVVDEIFPNSATIHPYKLHFRDYTDGNFDPLNPTGFTDVIHPTGNLVMAMGCAPDTQPYIFNLDGVERLDYIFAVGCTYAVSAASKNQRFTPEFRIPQHNKKAASEVHVEIESNNLRGSDPSSQCTINVKVLDMSHGIAAGDALDQMHAVSDVASISVEITGITSSPVVTSSPVPISGSPRDPADPLLYQMVITNSASGASGTYTGCVKVTDSYSASQNSSPLLNGMDGIQRVAPIVNPLTGLFSIPEFATYAVFKVDVSSATELPVCDIEAIPANANVFTDQELSLDGSGSYDPDGTIQSYEWDFTYDGVTFNVDASGASVSTSYDTEGTYTAALRVTDDMLASSICTIEVTVSQSTIPDDFIPIDNVNIGQNVTIVEDYNGYLHAFYGKPASVTDETSNIYWAYSADHGNTWQGHLKIYETTPANNFHVIIGSYSKMVGAFATGGPIIYIAWLEHDWLPSQWQQRIMAGELDISNLSSPILTSVVVHTGAVPYSYPTPQIIALSDNKIMMYYMEYRGTGWFEPAYKFCYFNNLSDSQTPTKFFSSSTLNGSLIYVYNSSSPVLASDSNDNILYTISGRFYGISNPTPPTVPYPPYDSGYGSAILRYNMSGDYNTGDNWTFVQHYGCQGSQFYWDNWTQAICIDESDNVHWVFEYEINGGSNSELNGDYFMVYGTGPSTGQFNFQYKDPIHPDMHDNGASVTAEFRYASIDTNSQGEVWITYQDSVNVPEIYYTWSANPLSSWQTPVQMTVPPMDNAWYPYMFISSWDAMYVVMSDASTNGYPWIRAINTL